MSATYTHHRVHCNENVKPGPILLLCQWTTITFLIFPSNIHLNNQPLLQVIISFSSRQSHRRCELQKTQTRPKFDDHIAIQTIHDSQPVLIPSTHFLAMQSTHYLEVSEVSQQFRQHLLSRQSSGKPTAASANRQNVCFDMSVAPVGDRGLAVGTSPCITALFCFFFFPGNLSPVIAFCAFLRLSTFSGRTTHSSADSHTHADGSTKAEQAAARGWDTSSDYPVYCHEEKQQP